MSIRGKERKTNNKKMTIVYIGFLNIQEAYSLEEEIAWLYLPAVAIMITNTEGTKELQMSAGRSCLQCVWQGDEALCQGQAVLSRRHQKGWLKVFLPHSGRPWDSQISQTHKLTPREGRERAQEYTGRLFQLFVHS